MIRIYALNGLLGPDGYLIGTFLSPVLGIKNFFLLGNQGTVILGMIYAYAPFMAYPIYLALMKIPIQFVEAAVDLGARHYNVFWHIIFPLSLSGLATGCSMVFVSSFCDGVIPEILGDDKTLVMGRVILHTFFQERNWPKSCALALLSLTALLIPWLCAYICRRPHERIT
jgi:putrescine transport system permease protein